MATGLKDRELQDYYESLIDMYASKGWAHFTADMQKLFDAANTLDAIDSLEDLHFRRGQIDILRRVVAQPAVMEAAYDELLKAEDD